MKGSAQWEKPMSKHIQQRGAALAIGLILLVVATILAVTAMRGTVTNERLASNQRQISEAFMAAETGISEAINWFNTGDNYKSYPTGAWGNTPIALAGIGTGVTRPGIGWAIDDLDFIDDKVTIRARGFVTATDTERVVRVDYRRPLLSGPAGAFLVGLLSDQNITVNGASSFSGSVHANGNFSNPSGGSTLNDWTDGDGNLVTANISASGTANYGGATGMGSVTSGTPNVDVPSAGAHIQDVLADPAFTVIEDCNIPAGDLGGAIYYCAGPSLTLGPSSKGGKSGPPTSYSNGTIMVNGNVTFNGSSALGADGALDLAVIASGNITMNGSSDAYGLWWADGTVTQNGASVLGGAVVAINNITRNGEFNFVQVDKFGPDIPLPMDPDKPAAITDWREIN